MWGTRSDGTGPYSALKMLGINREDAARRNENGSLSFSLIYKLKLEFNLICHEIMIKRITSSGEQNFFHEQYCTTEIQKKSSYPPIAPLPSHQKNIQRGTNPPVAKICSAFMCSPVIYVMTWYLSEHYM